MGNKWTMVISGVFVTAAWLYPVIRMKLNWKEIGKMTVSRLAEGK